MTIKTQVVDDETRIITRVIDDEIRVSCTCCETGECCMYPAAGLLDALFTYEDLPDQLIYKGRSGGDVTFNKLDPPLEFGSSFAYYISTTSPSYGSGDEDVIIIDDNANWLNWISAGLNSIGLCLIEGYEETSGTADVFPDELNREGAIGPAERVSLCQWCLEGDELNDGAFTVIYFDGQATSDCNGRFFATSLTPHSWYLAPVGDGLYRKTGNQNTPIGTYEAINTPGLTQEIT
jgi:hypothetical protein